MRINITDVFKRVAIVSCIFAGGIVYAQSNGEHTETIRKYLKEFEHQKKLFGDRAAKRNDDVYNSLKMSLEISQQERAVERIRPDASPEEKRAYYQALKEETAKKREIIDQYLETSPYKDAAGNSILDQYRDENGKLNTEKLIDAMKEQKGTTEKKNEKERENITTGDAKTACEVILCMSSGSQPSECTPPIEEYLKRTIRKEWSDTLSERRKFLSFCPSTGDQKVAQLAMDHAELGDECNLDYYNRRARTISYNGIDPMLDKRPFQSEDIITIDVIDDHISKECANYLNNDMMDLYLTPFRQQDQLEVIKVYKKAFNPTFDSKTNRQTEDKAYKQVYDLKTNKIFTFGTWYYEKPLDQK